MILLCGGEGAAGVKTGGAFFLLVSYAGPNADQNGIRAAAHENAVRLMPVEDVGAYARSKPAAPARRGLLHSV